jgi:hypothetical protein
VAEISTFRLILSIFLVNGIGFTLRYFGYDTYAVIAGFRLHLSFCLPLLILYPAGLLNKAKELLIRPVYKKNFIVVTWIIIIPAIIMAVLYLLEKIELADPDYFYEFGLSSIFDFPVYLIWNFPQFVLLFLFLKLSTEKKKNNFFPVLALIILLFMYEFIPITFKFEEPDLITAGNFVLTAFCAAFLFHFYNNLYWFTIVIFSAFWFNLLAFGSETESMINMLFAAQYQQWEGFFTISKDYKPWLLGTQLLLMLIILSVSLPSRKISGIDTIPAFELNSVKSDLPG